MTEQFDRLLERPQIKITRGGLRPEERMLLRSIQFTRNSDVSPPYDGSFTTVYYLAGDERSAAKMFVEENRDQLEAINFDHPDPIQSSVPRDVYDWILHFLGERELRKYRSVVYERRRSGYEWVIDREVFEQYPERRYSSRDSAARVGSKTTMEELYHSFDDQITQNHLETHAEVDWAVEYVLEYYCTAGPFDCEAITIRGQPAIQKQT